MIDDDYLYAEGLHRVSVAVSGIGYDSKSDFIITGQALRKAINARSILGIELHERAVSVVEDWLHYVTTAPIPEPDKLRFPLAPQPAPKKRLRSRFKDWLLNFVYRYVR